MKKNAKAIKLAIDLVKLRLQPIIKTKIQTP